MAKNNVDIIKVAVMIAIFNLGGWLIFQGFISIFGLETLKPLYSLLAGLGIIFVGVKLGLNKLRLN